MQDFYFNNLFFNKAWIISDPIMHRQSFFNHYFDDYTEKSTELFKIHYLINIQKIKPRDL